MAHSVVGRRVGFDVDVAAGIIRVDQEAQNGINLMLGLPLLNDDDADKDGDEEGGNNDDNALDDVSKESSVSLNTSSSHSEVSLGSSSEESEPQSQTPEMRAYGTPTDSEFKSANTFTCVETSKLSYVNIVRRQRQNKKQQKSVSPLADQRVIQVGLVATATRLASTFISMGVVDIRDGSTESPLYASASLFPLKQEYSPSKGFARRDYNEDIYGNQYLEEFKPLIKELYEVGENESSNKMQPDQMREHIVQLHPHRFSIPSSTTIQQYSSSLAQAKKKH
eukprot:scaffold349772_cov35-Attheya_sp.AAC.1